MTTVQFRFLKLMLNHVTGDHVSVALVHWDGRTLRVDSAPNRVKYVELPQRDVVRASVSAFVRRAEKSAKQAAKRPILDIGLEAVFPVREGVGGALHWEPVTRVEVVDPESHFGQLSEELHGGPARRGRSRRVTDHALREQIGAAAEAIAMERPKRVKLDRPVSRVHEYVSPLSWKNGKWHHAVPFSFDGKSVEEMHREAESVLGLARLGIPERDVPILVAVYPEDAELARQARREARAVRNDLRERGCDLVPAKRKRGKLSLDTLIARVERDLDPDG